MTDPQSDKTAEPARSLTAAFTFLIITAFINSMGIGLTSPVMPALVMEISGGDVAGAALWGGLALFVFAIMQFIFAPIVGGLSDRYGRRPVLLFSMAAFAIDMLVLAVVQSLALFIIVRAFAGIFAASFSTANAYVADVTAPEKRAQRFAVLGAAFGAGFVFGPAIGGALGDINTRLPFYAGAALAAANAIYGYFVVSESLPTERRRTFSWRRANTVGTLVRLFATPGVGQLLPVYFLATLSSWVYPTVWSYVAIEKFAWTEGQIGASIAFYGIISFISQALVIQFLLPKIGVRTAIRVALLFEIVSLTGIGFAAEGWFVYSMVTLALISLMQDPALRQELSARVPEDAQGELQGGLSALTSVAMILSPLLYMGLFTATAGSRAVVDFPGAPFVAAAAISFLTLVFYNRAIRPDASAAKPAPEGR